MISSFFISGNQTANGGAEWITPASSLSTVYAGNSVVTNVKALSSRGRKVTYAVTAGTLPPGLSLIPESGKLIGVVPPGVNTQTYTFTISALD